VLVVQILRAHLPLLPALLLRLVGGAGTGGGAGGWGTLTAVAGTRWLRTAGGVGAGITAVVAGCAGAGLGGSRRLLLTSCSSGLVLCGERRGGGGGRGGSVVGIRHRHGEA